MTAATPPITFCLPIASLPTGAYTVLVTVRDGESTVRINGVGK